MMKKKNHFSRQTSSPGDGGVANVLADLLRQTETLHEMNAETMKQAQRTAQVSKKLIHDLSKALKQAQDEAVQHKQKEEQWLAERAILLEQTNRQDVVGNHVESDSDRSVLRPIDGNLGSRNRQQSQSTEGTSRSQDSTPPSPVANGTSHQQELLVNSIEQQRLLEMLEVERLEQERLTREFLDRERLEREKIEREHFAQLLEEEAEREEAFNKQRIEQEARNKQTAEREASRKKKVEQEAARKKKIEQGRAARLEKQLREKQRAQEIEEKNAREADERARREAKLVKVQLLKQEQAQREAFLKQEQDLHMETRRKADKEFISVQAPTEDQQSSRIIVDRAPANSKEKDTKSTTRLFQKTGHEGNQDDLVTYLYQDLAVSGAEQHTVSPIFGMLQHKRTTELARTLLSLENKYVTSKREVVLLSRQRGDLQNTIEDLKADEADLDGKLSAKIDRMKVQLAIAKEKVNMLLKREVTRKSTQARLLELEGKLPWTGKIRNEVKNLKDSLETFDNSDDQEATLNERITTAEVESRMERKSIQKNLEDPTKRLQQLDKKLEGMGKELQATGDELEHHKKGVAEYGPDFETLFRLAQSDRPKDKIDSLPSVLAASVERKIEDIHKGSSEGLAEDVELNTRILQATRAAVRALVDHPVTSNGNAKESKSIFGAIFGKNEKANKNSFTQAIAGAGFPDVDEDRLDRIMTYLRQCLQQREDPRFDINDQRDVQGRTFLMVAVQGNDITTAQLCFGLGSRASEKCQRGLTAMFFAQYFNFRAMADLVARHGGDDTGDSTWDALHSASVKTLHPINWETQLVVAEKAAIPAETKLATTFEKSDTEVKVYPISDDYKDTSGRAILANLVDRLKNADPVFCHRRFVVGVAREKQFEVLCTQLTESTNDSPKIIAADATIVFYSPYVESEINGVSKVGVLLWAITTEKEAEKYKSLIEAAEFRRFKLHYPNDRFPAHRDFVLELGKDTHLLDLLGTSIFSSRAMELLILNVDVGGFERLGRGNFEPRKWLLHHEQVLQDAIFSSGDRESQDNEQLLKGPRLSSNISGGAGTGKTVTLIQKVSSEDVYKKILVVSRLPRLISFVKARVSAERDTSNVIFSTYDELLTLLVRRVTPSDEEDHQTFSAFTQVQYGVTETSGVASSETFAVDFCQSFLESGERKRMKENSILPLSLWAAFRTIKSSAKCSETKAPLSREDYVSLPTSYGMTGAQRTVVYDLFTRYQEWLFTSPYKWDEADRILYILRWGMAVFADAEFIPWEERALKRGETDLLDIDGQPLAPFFFHLVCADEAQDFSELDLSLFMRMSRNLRSVFLAADPAQSVELGVRMRTGTVNGVFHSLLPTGSKTQVKDVLQDLSLKTNHRTHARNLEMAKAVRKILSRSFGVPGSDENAIIEGPIPEALLLKTMDELQDEHLFRGGNVVFVVPDELVLEVRATFLQCGVKNDVFGVREAKGLEFSSVAVIGFFSYFDKLGCGREWENVIRWLFSTKSITSKDSAEKVQGKSLDSCDYVLSKPELEDQAMMLYTAMTRAQGNLYLIDFEGDQKRRQTSLADFAFRQLKQLKLLKIVKSIDAGEMDMSPQEHKARGVLMAVQAVNMSRTSTATEVVRAKFKEVEDRFQPDKGNDTELLQQCTKHIDAFLMKRLLIQTVRNNFFDKEKGAYNLKGQFDIVLQFEKDVATFFQFCANDSFLVAELDEIRVLVERVFYGTPYEPHFAEIDDLLRKFGHL